MAAVRPVTVFEAYDRSKKGKKVPESTWDYEILPANLAKVKDKYKIKFGDGIIPEDKDLKDRLFKAGLEMLVETGVYNQDLGRVIKVTQDEVIAGIKKTPRFLLSGEGRDVAKFYPRRGNSPVKPIIQGGPTGAPVSEDVFIQVMQSYAQEATVDVLVNGVMEKIEGHPATTNTPWEVRATMAELRAVREACIRAGRPGLAI